jgi:hypothetical protein
MGDSIVSHASISATDKEKTAASTMTFRQGCIHNKLELLRENANNEPQGLGLYLAIS